MQPLRRGLLLLAGAGLPLLGLGGCVAAAPPQPSQTPGTGMGRALDHTRQAVEALDQRNQQVDQQLRRAGISPEP